MNKEQTNITGLCYGDSHQTKLLVGDLWVYFERRFSRYEQWILWFVFGWSSMLIDQCDDGRGHYVSPIGVIFESTPEEKEPS